MAGGVRKALVLNNFNVGTDPGNSLYYWAPDIQAMNTPWLRLWVDWVALAPTAPPEGEPVNPALDEEIPAGGGWSPAQYVAYLDFQVRAAKEAGLGVILTFWLYPNWVNGGTAVYGLPGDVGPESPWAQYLLWVMTRYNAFNPDAQGGHCDVLEICNETDLGGAGPDLAVKAATTAQMMVTAAKLKRDHGLRSPLLAGPGHTDLGFHADFVDLLLAELRRLGFVGDAGFAWSMHNYADMQDATTARAQNVRARLAPVWAGWPNGTPGAPQILTTEGGSQAPNRTDQRNAVVRAHQLWSHPATGDGLAMFSQYLNVSSPVFDTGMRNFSPYGNEGGRPEAAFPRRPLWRAWAGL